MEVDSNHAGTVQGNVLVLVPNRLIDLEADREPTSWVPVSCLQSAVNAMPPPRPMRAPSLSGLRRRAPRHTLNDLKTHLAANNLTPERLADPATFAVDS